MTTNECNKMILKAVYLAKGKEIFYSKKHEMFQDIRFSKKYY